MRISQSTIALSALTFMLTVLTSCEDKYSYNPDWKRPHNEFNFSTERTYEFRLDYAHMNIKNYIFFRIYDKNPLENGTLDETLEPVFAGATEQNGIFYGKITLPSYIKEVYIYTDNIFAEPLIKAKVENGMITATDNKESAYEEVASFEETTKETTISLTENLGAYCFEDTWPTEGDYDFNDVVVKCSQTTRWAVSSTRTKTKSGKLGNIYSGNLKIDQVELTIKAYQGETTQQDGLYCFVDLPNGMSVDKEEYFIRRSGETEWKSFSPTRSLHLEELYNKHGDFNYNNYGTGNIYTIWLTNSIADDGQGTEYKVVLNYLSTRTSTLKSTFRPFIAVRNGAIPYSSDVPYYEVHVPYETPTNIMPMKYWSMAYDASLPATITSQDEGTFFIRAYEKGTPYNANYPFAMKLTGAIEADIQPLTGHSSEGTPFSSLYTHYTKWVESDGEEYADWYKNSK